MTPAVDALRSAAVSHELLEYSIDDNDGREIGRAAAAALGVPEAAVFKTLMAELATSELVVAIIPVAEKLSLKLLARAAGAKSAKMADPQRAERATGYVTGGISPLGQKRAHRTFLASSASSLETIYVSAGRRGLQLALRPEDLSTMTRAHACPLTT